MAGTYTEAAEEDIFGPQRNEVTGEWRKLHNGELRHCTLGIGVLSYIGTI
jgi:hypothetical protein